MDGERINGSWRIAGSTDAAIIKGTTAHLVIVPDGLQIRIDGAASYEIPWRVATLKTAISGQTVITTGHGQVWIDPGPGANAAELADAFNGNYVDEPANRYEEFEAGSGQVLVLYRGADDGNEVDPAPLLAAIAADAAERASQGWRLASMVGLPLRHAGQKMFGIEGSGYTTKAAIAGLYVFEAPTGAAPESA